VSKTQKLKKLVSLDENERFKNKDFIERVKQARYSIAFWWKNHFGLSSNSSEFLEATETQMYEDYLDFILGNHVKDYDPITEEMVLGRINDEHYDIKIAENFKQSLKNIKVLTQKIKLN
jgi:hypothetical protein